MKANDTRNCDGSLVIPEVAAARALSDERRQSVMKDFFEHFPGAGHQAPGLGLALLDFQQWEIDSGRVPASPWWSAVNGLLVTDIEAALVSRERHATANIDGAGAGAKAWMRYTEERDNPQGALWDAHQISINCAATLCEGLLGLEVTPERSFATCALALVEQSAHAVATDETTLGELTRRHYPPAHPITQTELDGLQARLFVGQSGSR